MNKVFSSLLEIRDSIRDRADDVVGKYRHSTPKLIGTLLWNIATSFSTIGCFFICILWFKKMVDGPYVWLALVATILSPITLCTCFYRIETATWHLAQK